MASFDPADITRIARVFGVPSEQIRARLGSDTLVITENDKTAVLADLTAYEAIENYDVSIEPKERNFGASIGAGTKRSLIKTRIAGLLAIETVSSATCSMVRG